MATVINLPQNPSFGEGLGQGVSAGLMKHLEEQAKQEKTQTAQLLYMKLQNAQTPEELNSVVVAAGSSGTFEDVDDLGAFHRLIEARRAQLAPTGIDFLDPSTNKEQTKYVQKEDFMGEVEGLRSLGMVPGGKAEEEIDWMVPSAEHGGEYLAQRGPVSQRPHLGLRAEEMELIQARKEGEAKQKADKRADERLDLAADREERQVKAATRTADNTATDNLRANLDKLERSTATALGGTYNLDTGDFTFGDVNQRKRWKDATKTGAQFLRQGKAKDYIQARELALKEHPEGKYKVKTAEASSKKDKEKEKGDDGLSLFQKAKARIGMEIDLREAGNPEKAYEELPEGASFIAPDGRKGVKGAHKKKDKK